MAELFLWILTTVIAGLALYSTEWRAIHYRLLPWTGGVLLGISFFWIVPDVAEVAGWPVALTAIAAGVVILVLIDRYIYPVCPFCALGVHHPVTRYALPGRSAQIRAGWPLLLAGCLHNFFDGYLLAFGRELPTAQAISWGFAAHKIPEAFALGFLASALARNSRIAFAAVLFVQCSFALGTAATVFTAGWDSHIMRLCVAGAGATLVYFGFSALQFEWQMRGPSPALRVGSFGIGGCGLLAFLIRCMR